MDSPSAAREEILEIVRRQDYSALLELMTRLDPEEHGDDYLVALVHQQYWYWTKGQLSGPARVCRSVLRRTSDPYVQSIAHVYLGEIEELLGNTLQSERHLRQAARVGDHPGLVANANNCLGLLFFNLGFFELARELYARAHEIAAPLFVTNLSALGAARASVGLGQFDAFEEWFGRAERIFAQYAHFNRSDQEIHSIIVLGELAAKQCKLTQALDCFERALMLASDPPRERLRLRAIESRVTTSIEHLLPTARDELREFREEATKRKIQLAIHRSLRLEARHAYLNGAPHEVIVDTCERISDPTQRVVAIAMVGSASPAEIRMRVHDAATELSPVVRQALLDRLGDP